MATNRPVQLAPPETMISPMGMIVLGVLLAGSHVIFLIIILSWFALRKPTSWALVRSRFKEALHR